MQTVLRAPVGPILESFLPFNLSNYLEMLLYKSVLSITLFYLPTQPVRWVKLLDHLLALYCIHSLIQADAQNVTSLTSMNTTMQFTDTLLSRHTQFSYSYLQKHPIFFSIFSSDWSTSLLFHPPAHQCTRKARLNKVATRQKMYLLNIYTIVMR